MACNLSPEVKKVILRVLEFCKEEKMNRTTIIPLAKVNLRVATATGVSIHTVSNIIRDAKIAAATGTKIGAEKKRKPRNDKLIFSDFDLDLIRDIIKDYCLEHNEMPSIKKLLPLVRKQIGYTGGHETLRKAVKQIGFTYSRVAKNEWATINESVTLLHAEHDYTLS
ncbi:uncharacterized protein LOC114354436 isoform X2 [Ostrinia furnacalis]|nr:uncharacterized protein LOC114354436 isoform X2 [Ostrinia furnacalis]